MAEINLTPSQKLAIESRGTSLLVSAAAGSGKTQVIIRRLMSYISCGAAESDIDDFLVITYTRAAAAELRGRVMDELSSLAEKNPVDRRLKNQPALCYRAQIGTIHSFCAGILRENAHVLGIAPDFRVIDEDAADAIKSGVLEKLLDAAYERIEEEPGFRALADTVGAGRDDKRLVKIILNLYSRMQSHAYPDEWAAEQAAALKIPPGTDVGKTAWGKEIMDWARQSAGYWSEQFDNIARRLTADGEETAAVSKAYSDSILETLEAIRGLKKALDEGWEAAGKRIPVPFPSLRPLRKEKSGELAERIKSRREACKKDMGRVAELLTDSPSELLADMESVRPAMETLLSLTLRFEAAYFREKNRQGCLDYSDLEHLAVRLLVSKETGAPTLAAKELSRRFTEIMVDEYQDINAVQDMIISALSREGRNIFMVGDIKQSIYRFRLADPGIFIAKYLSYADAARDRSEQAEKRPRRILLQENFRSRKAILDAANHVFSNIMSKELGELDYDDGARLVAGAEYPEEGDVPALFTLLCLPEHADAEERPDSVAKEAEFIARQICKLVASGEKIIRNGEPGNVDYGDIVILLRSPNASGPAYRRALENAGVPVDAELSGGFFGSVEITAMISLLTVIDNPRQDIPLISALRSPIFGFTADELSEIRACDKEGDFYAALESHAAQSDRSRDFLRLLEGLREGAPDMPADRLIWRTYNKTGIFALCAALSSNAARRQNLMRLFEYGRKFEESGQHGLFRFIAWLRRLAERGGEGLAQGSGGNAVRIMSIHKSKGLEFPVVFLCDTSRRFNKRDLSENVLVHAELGLGPKLIDADRGLEYPTLARRAIRARQNRELLSEEMRVLYVAMTRAKERLYISAAVKRPEQLMQKLGEALSGPVAPRLLETAASPAEWLLMAAMLPGGQLELKIANPGELPAPAAADDPEKIKPPAATDESVFADLKRRLGYVYPYREATALPSKLTATELKGLPDEAEFNQAESAQLTHVADYDFSPPEFIAGGDLTWAQRGTAAHIVMQYIDLKRTRSEEEIHSEIERISALGHLSGAEALAVDVKAVSDFFRSDIGQRLLTADSVTREFRFSLLCDASDFFDAPEEDKILLQGVVDCYIEEKNELTIIDYKTDYVNQIDVTERAEKYEAQVRAYAKAMSRVTGKRVSRAFLYFLKAGTAVEIKIS